MLIGDSIGQIFVISIDSFSPINVRTQKLWSL